MSLAVAALMVVLYRRDLRDRVAVRCEVADSGRTVRGVVVAELSDDLPFSALVVSVAADLAALADDIETEDGTADAVFTVAEGRIAIGGTDAALEAQLGAALEAGRRDPACAVSVLGLTTPNDLTWLRTVSGDGRAPVPARCIHDVVAEHAARTPQKIAVSCAADTLTYGRLDERAESVAAVLRSAGARPGDVIGVLAPRSPALLVTLLAVLKTGGAYLALDPEDPPARHELLLRDARAGLVIVDASLRAPDGSGRRVLPLTEEAFARPAGARQTPPLSPDHVAYVSYTSGSTGEPKGVAVPHRAVSRLVRAPNWVEIGPDDVLLELAPVAFDASTVEIWGALLNGARLAVLPPGPFELERLAGTVEAEGVTVLLLATGLFHQMVAAHIDSFRDVRHVLTGGDVVSPTLVTKLMEAHPHLLFTNGYGPTENTSFTTCWTSRTPPRTERVPIGVPVSGTSVAVLDPRLEHVPAGVCGELYAGGEGVARGYVNRPAATAERFVPDPWSPVPGARMYGTGDLVRRLADGTLEFVGRVDAQVKVQGYRVEPGAVEAALTARPDIEQAVVVVQSGNADGKRLLAYVVPADPDDRALAVRLRDELRETLPAYAVPWAIVVAPSLPLTRNGKVDRRALPAASRVPRALWNEFVTPGTAMERSVAEIWGELLRIEPIGVEDDFFELGGHSLLAAELIGAIRHRLNLIVPARAIYLRPTVRELAGELETIAAG